MSYLGLLFFTQILTHHSMRRILRDPSPILWTDFDYILPGTFRSPATRVNISSSYLYTGGADKFFV
jgi:hypothetical protein